MTQSSNGGPTVVLVHAAWADGSSWNNLTQALQSRGLHVIAAPIPMTASEISAVPSERRNDSRVPSPHTTSSRSDCSPEV